MTKNFKITVAELIENHAVSKNPAFIIEVCKYLEIEDYLIGYLNSLGFKIVQTDIGNVFVSTEERLNSLSNAEHALGKSLFFESLEVVLGIYEYCYLNKLDRSTTKNSIIGILMRYHDCFSYKAGNSISMLEYIHDNVKEHKRITEDSLVMVRKIVTNKATTKNKIVFPLDILDDARRIRFLQAQSENDRQSFILGIWAEFRERFEADFKNRSFSWTDSELSWTYFNFRAWIIAGNWSTAWAKNKAFCLNWNQKIKDSLEIFSKLDAEFSEASLLKFYQFRQPPKKGTQNGKTSSLHSA